MLNTWLTRWLAARPGLLYSQIPPAKKNARGGRMKIQKDHSPRLRQRLCEAFAAAAVPTAARLAAESEELQKQQPQEQL